MTLVLKGLTLLTGLLFTHHCLRWLIEPEFMADFFSLSLKGVKGEGLGHLISIFATLFFVLSTTTLFGLRQGKAHFLFVPLLASISLILFRFWIYFLGYGVLSWVAIGLELIIALILAATLYDQRRSLIP